MRKAEWYVRRTGATRVSILMIDMELMDMPINALEFAEHYRFQTPEFYEDEVLYLNTIAHSAVVAQIKAALPLQHESFNINLARMKVPRDLLRDAADRDRIWGVAGPSTKETGNIQSNAIWRWLYDEVYSVIGLPDEILTLRLMQAMCVDRWDE